MGDPSRELPNWNPEDAPESQSAQSELAEEALRHTCPLTLTQALTHPHSHSRSDTHALSHTHTHSHTLTRSLTHATRTPGYTNTHSLSHTHTHTYMPTHTLTQSYAHALTHPVTHIHTHAHVLTHSHTYSDPLTRTCTLTFSHSHIRSHSHSYTHTQSHIPTVTHSVTHIHTHTPLETSTLAPLTPHRRSPEASLQGVTNHGLQGQGQDGSGPRDAGRCQPTVRHENEETPGALARHSRTRRVTADRRQKGRRCPPVTERLAASGALDHGHRCCACVGPTSAGETAPRGPGASSRGVWVSRACLLSPRW